LTNVKTLNNTDSHWKKLKYLIGGLVRFKRQEAVHLDNPD